MPSAPAPSTESSPTPFSCNVLANSKISPTWSRSNSTRSRLNSPESGKLLAIRGQDDLSPIDLGMEHRTTLLNLNGNYTGLPVLVHPCTLNPDVRLHFILQQLIIEGKEAGVIRDGVGGLGCVVHTGAFDPDACNGEAEVGNEEDGEGSSDGHGRRDQDRAQGAGQDAWSSSMWSRFSPTCEISPAPRVSTRSPLSEICLRTPGMASCWGT